MAEVRSRLAVNSPTYYCRYGESSASLARVKSRNDRRKLELEVLVIINGETSLENGDDSRIPDAQDCTR